MAKEVAAINRQIQELAPVLNSPDAANGASVTSSRGAGPDRPGDEASRRPAVRVRRRHARGRNDGDLQAAGRGRARVEVLGEGRTMEAGNGEWKDRFTDYQVHLYRIDPGR